MVENDTVSFQFLYEPSELSEDPFEDAFYDEDEEESIEEAEEGPITDTTRALFIKETLHSINRAMKYLGDLQLPLAAELYISLADIEDELENLNVVLLKVQLNVPMETLFMSAEFSVGNGKVKFSPYILEELPPFPVKELSSQ